MLKTPLRSMPKTTDPEKLEKFKKAGVAPNTPGLWKEKWNCGDSVVMKHKITGEERPHHYTQEEKQIIKNGDTLQPWQDKDAYIRRYGTLPGEDQKDVDRYIMRNVIKFSDISREALAKQRGEAFKRKFF